MQRSPSRSNGNPLGPVRMSEQQMKEYLYDLRMNRVPRPNGSRPPPPSLKRASLGSDFAHSVTPSRSSSCSPHRPSLDQNYIRPKVDGPPTLASRDRDLSPQEFDQEDMQGDGKSAEQSEEERVHTAARKEADELIRDHQGAEDATLNPSIVHTKSAAAAHSGQQSDSFALPPIRKQRSISRLTSQLAISSLGSRRRSSGKRQISGKHSGPFTNPDDKIYEDNTESQRRALSSVRRNPFARAHAGRTTASSSMSSWPKLTSATSKSPQSSVGSATSAVETHGVGTLINASMSSGQQKHIEHPEKQSDQFPGGKEIRSDEIRAATAVKLKDRSPRLPKPTAVSDSPNRPIVSFKSDYVPPEREGSSTPNIDNTGPAHESTHEDVTIHTDRQIPLVGPDIKIEYVSESLHEGPTLPKISISEPEGQDMSMPAIAIMETKDDPPVKQRNFKTPVATQHDVRRRNDGNSLTKSASTLPHWSPVPAKNAILCAQCALTIAGRIVTAAGARFHPDCFNCYHCGEALECVAFYPEPHDRRIARLDRMQRRMNGESVDEKQGQSELDDGDDSLRFYCHLDFHELFSPRCKSCKTPIEGEVIVACGAEWHVGHFFCAQCGDPFDPSTPFVEKDGYAWCVRCHTNRFSGKCKKCKQPITETVVNALDAEWHEGCFRCSECNGTFDDGRYFLRENCGDPVCFGCEERRLKAAPLR